MSLTRPTLQQLVDRVAADFKASISGATTLALRSVLQVMARVIAGVVHLLYGFIINFSKQLFITTATGSYLERAGSEYGILRNAATYAKGTIAITGVNGTAIPAGTEFQNAAGYEYATDALVTIPVGGTIDADVTATTAGEDSNDNAGITLTFISPIVGADTTATVDSDGLSSGTDEETDAAYRTRILDRKQFAPQGGCEQDYINWAKEVSGVTRAWVYEQYQGEGTLALYFVRDNDSITIIPSTAEILDVENHLISHEDSAGRSVGIPVTAKPGLFVLAPTVVYVDFSIAVYPNTAAVQAAIQAELEDLLYREGFPGNSVYLSQISEAISQATGEIRHRVTAPAADVDLNYNEVALMGTITWSDF